MHSIATDNCRISLFLGNSLYLIAFSYYTIITFLGYNGMSLSSSAGSTATDTAHQYSSSILTTHGTPPVTDIRVWRPVDRQPVRVQPAQARGACTAHGRPATRMAGGSEWNTIMTSLDILPEEDVLLLPS